MAVIDYSSITELNLYNKKLNDLPDLSLYKNLIQLDCRDNNLTYINNLPITLKKLYCDHNNLTILDNLPYGLEDLGCGNNNIIYLDDLPATLKILYCHVNKLILFLYLLVCLF